MVRIMKELTSLEREMELANSFLKISHVMKENSPMMFLKDAAPTNGLMEENTPEIGLITK